MNYYGKEREKEKRFNFLCASTRPILPVVNKVARRARFEVKSEYWCKRAWANRSPSGILPLSTANCVLVARLIDRLNAS